MKGSTKMLISTIDQSFLCYNIDSHVIICIIVSVCDGVFMSVVAIGMDEEKHKLH